MQYPTTTVSGIHSTAIHYLMFAELVTLFHTAKGCIIALELLMQAFCYPSFGTAKCASQQLQCILKLLNDRLLYWE